MGSTNKPATHIKDQNGNKLQNDQDIEQAFRRQWSKGFTVTDEKNEEFDDEHEATIRNIMENFIQ